MNIRCELCPHRCSLAEGQIGLCRGRVNRNGRVVCLNYGEATSLALDPIEKKPFARFHPGSRILSYGSYGCNLRCPFCQNAEISMAGRGDIATRPLTPEGLAQAARKLVPQGNIGVAYTYNEPLVGYEFVLDCSRAVHAEGLLNAIVTNGMILPGPLDALLPYTDAMNIDLKGYTDAFYRWVGGDLETVKGSITRAAKACHVEVTTLVIPTRNDSEDEMAREADFLASVNPELPLHLSRFFPRYKVLDLSPTPLETLERLAAVARQRLKHVYLGNV